MIRPGQADDAEGIRQVHIRSVHAFCAGHYSPEQLIALLGGREAADYRAAMTEWGEHVLVAEQAERVVGFAALYSAEVRAVYVDPVAAKGTGRRLLEGIEGLAGARGAGALHLTSSLNAVGFYEAMGYQRQGPRLMTMGCGTQLAAWGMRKALGRPVTAGIQESIPNAEAGR
ncbi:GNAT family N-acetyltransferase [Nitrospirillum sp. BR 11752]|uniref:GNAT family N-acetyltransferase n=1 Tax=Nitrospirillum sp. BR 11752 TaxID=3104293 RepID=UPI002EA52331|nr:GNAT family N-acetyltransferase [Nitrospirillum sp. BR 11752]